MKKILSMLLVLAVLFSCIGTAFVTTASATTAEAAASTKAGTDEMIVADWLFNETVYYRNAEDVMSEYADLGITDVYFLVKGTAGRVSWKSNVPGTVQSFPEKDLLAETCAAAKKYGVRVHAWMVVGQDDTYRTANPSAVAYHFRIGTNYSSYNLTPFMNLRDSGYRSYMRALIKELNTYDIAGIHFDYIRYGTLFYDWGAEARNALINDYGITKAEYNAAVKAMCVTANEEYSGNYCYSTNSDGYYIYSSSGTYASGVTFAEALVGQGSTDALNGTKKVAQMRKDLVKNFIAEATADLSSDKDISCAIMPEAVSDYAASAYYCQDPAVLKDVVDYVSIMTYASQYGGASTWPASLAKTCAKAGCNAISAVQTFDCENSNADPTCTDIYDEFYNIVKAKNEIANDSAYSGKILGCAFFRAAKMTLASAYIKDSSNMTIKVHQQDELKTGVTKLVFTMKNGVKINSVTNKSGWGSSTFAVSSDKTKLTITSSQEILTSYGSASFDISYTGTISDTTGACFLQSYNSSGEDYGFCTTVYPRHTHSYTSKITQESTCAVPGVKTFTCSCGDSYTESLALVDHVYTSSVTTEPTCNAVGVRLFKCTGCSSAYTEDIPKIAHTYTEIFNEATGLTTYTCSHCGNTFESGCGLKHERIETWTAGENQHFAFCYKCNLGVTYSCKYVESSRVPATCTNGGSVTYVCGGHIDAHTGEIITDAFSNLGCTNTYTESIPAGCTFTYASNLDGTHHRVCVACGKTEAPSDCSYTNGVCTLCGYSEKDYTLLHFKKNSVETSWAWAMVNAAEETVTFDATSYGAMHGKTLDSSGNPYFLIWPQDNCGINHTVAAGDVVEVRLRMNISENPTGQTSCIPDVRLQSDYATSPSYASLTGNAKQSISLNTSAWQTVQIPIVGRIYSEGYVINRVLFDPWNTTMYLGAEIEIDYIYIGQPDTAPSASANNLYFDFTNSVSASARYNGDVYEGYNFDVIPWGFDSALSERPTFDYTAEGTLTVSGIVGSSAYARTLPFSNAVPSTPLEYKVAANDIVEIRFKTENLVAANGATPTVSLAYDINNAGAFAKSFNFSCSAAQILSGEYITVRTSATAGELISALRPTISGIKNNGNGKFIIDYIYVGANSTRPSINNESLFFNFTDEGEDRTRYDSYAYGYYNYDIGGWGVNSLKNSEPTFADGAMSTVVVGESPYLQINAGSNSLTTRPLHFNPSSVEMVQVRLKLENLERVDNTRPASFIFKFFVDDETVATTNSFMSYRLTEDQLTSGEYITISLPVGDYFEGISELTSIQLNASHVKPISGKTAKITVDSVYVGPMKDDLSFVYFYNSTGTYCLGIEAMEEGTQLTYRGDIPMMEPTSDYHYNFDGWADSTGSKIDLSTITNNGDIDLFASFALVEHEYTFSGEPNGHGGICSCGVSTNTEPHEWDGGKVVTEATCTTDGVIAYTCEICSYVREEVYAAGGHTYDIVVTAPTCTADGYTTYTCVCGDSYQSNYVEATGHNYNTVVKEASCTEAGYTTHTCATCNDSYTSDPVEAFGHSYESETTAPTCSAAGKTVYTCGTCGDTYEESIAKLGHKAVYREKTPATCTESGYIAHYNCTNCGKNFIDEACTYAVPDSYLVSAPTGHSIVFHADKDATCTEDGYYAHYRCENCGICYADADCKYNIPVDYITIAKLNHSYSSKVVAPTCAEAGYTLHTCANCGDSYKTNEVAAKGHSYTYAVSGDNHIVGCANCAYSKTEAHSFTSGSCVCGAVEKTEPTYKFNSNLSISMSISVGAEMQVIYNITNSKVKNFESFYLEVVQDVAEGEDIVNIFSLSNENMVPVTNAAGNISRYSVTFTGINASEMGDRFTATLYAVEADGTVNYGTSMASSIKDYLMGLLVDSTSSATLKTLAVDMLNYGTAAQTYFNYNTANPVNADLTAQQLALGTQVIPEAVDKSSSTTTGKRIITSVSLMSKVVLSITCPYAATTSSNLKFVIKDAKGKILEELAPTEINTNNCKATYDNVGAAQMRNLITIELYDNNVLVSRTVTWSIESYVAQMRASSTSAELINAVNAMLIYGDSAAAHFGPNN